MERGLYIAASGMLAELTRQDQIANDLANASTPGYKSDRSALASFGQILLRDSSTGNTVGPIELSTIVAATGMDKSQGALDRTEEPLDMALSGDGFFAVQTPQGTRYTRDGRFLIDAQGRLTTPTSLPVLDDQGRTITIGQGTPDVSSDGTISVKGQAIARLGVYTLTNPVKQGGSLLTGQPGARPAQTEVRQGYLEGSSVDPSESMVQMMNSLRSFEAMQRVIHTIDETLQRGIGGGGS